MKAAKYDLDAWTKVLEEDWQPPDVSDMKPVDATIEVCSDLELHIAYSPAVIEYLRNLPKGPGTNCPDSKPEELAKYLAFRRGDIDQSDAQVMIDLARDLMSPLFKFRDKVALEALGEVEGVSEMQYFVLSDAVSVARAVDDLYMAWFRAMALPYKQATPEEQKRWSSAWAGKLGEYDYSVFTVGKDGEIIDRRTWAAAFPNETVGVGIRLLMLRSNFDKTDPTYRYLSALMDAYDEHDVDRLEERWAEVDRCWIQIPPDAEFVPVHGFENYEHPYGVSPEFRLTWRVTSDAEAEQIAAYRRAARDYVDARSGILGASREAAQSKLSRLDIGVFFSAVEGGVCLGFRLSGQVVPNRQDILLQGGKIFIADRASGNSVTETYRDVVAKYCTPETTDVILPMITNSSLDKHTLGHECAHPIGCSMEIDSALGVTRDLLEETKASTCGFLIGLAVLDSDDNLRETAAVALVRALRFMAKSRLENQTIAPYVRENLVVLNTLLEARVLRLTADGVEADLTAERLQVWRAIIEEFVSETLVAYQNHDREKLSAMRSSLCGADDRGATEDMKAVIAWVNRPDGKEGKE